MEPPVFYETSWGILSTIGVFLAIASVSVILMTSICTLNFVPLIVSVACALANGLCYYAYYTGQGPHTGRLVASIFADIFWLIQEPGNSFYSYLILTHILCRRSRKIFLVVFWAFIVAIVALRVTIAIGRAIQLKQGNRSTQIVISRLHIGYFVSIALLETWSSFFLIKQMAKAYRRSPRTSSTHGVFLYLMRSAELRLAALCCIGIARAVTYSSQKMRQKATTTASQIDRFTYTLECLFPVILLLDILSAKRYRPNNATFDASSMDPESSSGMHHPNWISWSPSSREKTSD
ncbi:hypothetical protein BJX64DRAFT_286329 [Aspergillus heterothallicus]